MGNQHNFYEDYVNFLNSYNVSFLISETILYRLRNLNFSGGVWTPPFRSTQIVVSTWKIKISLIYVEKLPSVSLEHIPPSGKLKYPLKKCLVVWIHES